MASSSGSVPSTPTIRHYIPQSIPATVALSYSRDSLSSVYSFGPEDQHRTDDLDAWEGALRKNPWLQYGGGDNDAIVMVGQFVPRAVYNGKLQPVCASPSRQLQLEERLARLEQEVASLRSGKREAAASSNLQDAAPAARDS